MKGAVQGRSQQVTLHRGTPLALGHLHSFTYCTHTKAKAQDTEGQGMKIYLKLHAHPNELQLVSHLQGLT